MNKNIRIIHPGEVLREDFLIPNEITNEQLAKSLNVELEIINLLYKKDLFKYWFSLSFSRLSWDVCWLLLDYKKPMKLIW
ncbi:MAG: hypothetical protein AD073_000269 [Mycoplasmataceae bacterium]|nr:MAG: hypothetical protein AD073_000269 [Mycoplasmataceae bacterium]